jgi:hypothetical protein
MIINSSYSPLITVLFLSVIHVDDKSHDTENPKWGWVQG